MSSQSPFPWTSNRSLTSPNFDSSAPFSDPFTDVASTMMPTSIPAMLRHSEYLAVTNETFREALNRIPAYFVTEIEVAGELGDDEREAQKKYLEEDMCMLSNLIEAAVSCLVYGNQYTSVIQPIVRYLVCPQCHTQYKLSDIIERPECQVRLDSKFKARCLSCNYDGHMGGGPEGAPKDIPDESRPPIFKSWNPHDIRPVWVESLGQTVEYHWIIPADFRTEIKQAMTPGGNKAAICETPWEHIKAVLNDQNVKFKSDFIHHWYEHRLAGLRFRGYGVPRAIINYRQMFYTQILRRMNEVLALGHVVPIRVVSPANTSGRSNDEGDILKTAYMGDLRSRFNQILANHRADLNSVHFSPVPLQMQALGADARQLIPADILNQANDVILNGAGVPTDFYRMSLQTQAAPVALRLIERYWAPMVAGLNRLLTFVGRRMQILKKWETAKYSLASVRLVDSIELNQLRVQMAQAQLLSRSSALEAVDADFREETRRKNEENRIEQTENARAQQQQDAFAFSRQLADASPSPSGGMAQAQAGGDPSQGQGAPQNPGTQTAQPGNPDQINSVIPSPGGKIDPQELEGRATSAAQMLLSLPESVRYTKLQEISKVNPLFHKLVKGKLEELRSKARSQGQQLVLQQQFGQQSQQG